MDIRYAKDSDLDNIKYMWKYCFNDSDEFMNYYFNFKYKPQNTIVVEANDEIVSSLQLNQYKINLNNKTYDTSYIVGVSTLPQARGKGHMKNIMSNMLNELYLKNQLISILMPIDYRLYRKYGYEHCYDQIEYDLSMDDIQGFKSLGNLTPLKDEHIQDLVKINDEYFNDINGNVVKDNAYYQNLIEEIKSEGGNIYIHKTNDKYDGYIIYFIDSGKFIVREMVYNNISALKSMLNFIYNHNTQCKNVIISANLNDKIRFILKNPRNINIKLKPFMMGRIINFKGFMESLELDKEINTKLKIKIKDDYIKENNNTFIIDVVEGIIEIKETDELEDISLIINDISQLAFSYINIEEIILINDMKDMDDKIISKMNLLFNKKTNHINEYV